MHSLGVLKKNFAGFRNLDAQGAALKQFFSKLFFQCLDLQRNRGLRQGKRLACFAKAQVFGDCPEHLQAKVIEEQKISEDRKLQAIASPYGRSELLLGRVGNAGRILPAEVK
jgi:hypothetical protein